jgi:hypothetical protein
VVAGGGADQFWNKTPREIHAVLSAFNRRNRMAQRSELQAAWITAKLSRAKDIPSLEELSPSLFPRSAQSDTQMAHNLMLWNAALNPNSKPN